MAYIKTTWKDRLVERPNTFEVQENPDGTITLIPTPGTVTQAGTSVNAANLNKIEDGIVTLENNVTTHLADNTIHGKIESAIDIPLLNGFAGTLKAVKTPSGIVQITGFLTDGTRTSGTTVAVLPEGFRPAVTNVRVLSKTGNAADFYFYIYNYGDIRIQGTGASDGSSLAINQSFILF